MSHYDDVVSRCNKMSFLLGMATDALSEIIRIDNRPNEQKKPTIDLFHQLMNGVDDLYYTCDKPNE